MAKNRLSIRVLGGILIAAVCSSTLSAQQPTPQEQQFRRATRKMWIGAAMVGTGLFAMPLTAASARNNNNVDVGPVLDRFRLTLARSE